LNFPNGAFSGRNNNNKEQAIQIIYQINFLKKKRKKTKLLITVSIIS